MRARWTWALLLGALGCGTDHGVGDAATHDAFVVDAFVEDAIRLGRSPIGIGAPMHAWPSGPPVLGDMNRDGHLDVVLGGSVISVYLSDP